MKGEFRHTIDAKGRLFIPAKLRDELGEHFIITKGLDGCLFVYPEDGWGVLEDKIRALPLSKSRSLQRFFFSAATDSELDSQGRTLVPANLREYAGLQKEVTIIGVSGRAEIWDTARWAAYNDEITNESIEDAMEELGF
ncbi:division/cell wall cluster transcriptional repressor MraZ [Intestinibacillus massiliensis]|uniref:division/cell wall cluster transcriptional repressor MraZ n=1 Tax=Intestinibacillus massiliensis TaxID=1871029 RepID=UPI000B35FF02|nr:division/cell wall cluster transcriptional repressor MraZ [Intestinibacillus massiliensis]